MFLFRGLNEDELEQSRVYRKDLKLMTKDFFLFRVSFFKQTLKHCVFAVKVLFICIMMVSHLKIQCVRCRLSSLIDWVCLYMHIYVSVWEQSVELFSKCTFQMSVLGRVGRLKAGN